VGVLLCHLCLTNWVITAVRESRGTQSDTKWLPAHDADAGQLGCRWKA
jgi:hypothetical protein